MADAMPDAPPKAGNLSFTVSILAALLLGAAIGALAPAWASRLDWMSALFIRLVKSTIAPLIFGTLVHGIAQWRDARALRGIAAKALVYFFVVTTLAVGIGGASAALIRPGARAASATSSAVSTASALPSLDADAIVAQLVPTSIVQAMAEGHTLQIVVFAVLFGVGCVLAGSAAAPIVSACGALAQVMFRFTDLVMRLAPLGVFGAAAVAVSAHGLGAFLPMAALVATLFVGELALILLVFLPIGWLAGRHPIGRMVALRAPLLLAFSTASSEAALPGALRVLGEQGVRPSVAAFVLPAGMSLNLAGTCVYLAACVLFCAQIAGVTLGSAGTLLILGSLVLTSKGLAGVPRSAFVVLTGTLTAFQIPAAGVGLILGVDALLDMMRTSVNVLGNCVAAQAIDRWHDPSDRPAVQEETETEAGARAGAGYGWEEGR